MGETFAIILSGTCILSCIVGGLISYWIKTIYLAIPLAIFIPAALFAIYPLMNRDELAVWSLVLTLGLVSSVMGSVSGIAFVKLLTSRSNKTS